MEQAKHTPGPWFIEDVDDGQAVISAKSKTWIDFARVWVVTDEYPDKEGEANARLIAAAPDQHEALCCAPVLSMYHGPNGFEQERFIKDYETWNEQKRAAIAKATGSNQ